MPLLARQIPADQTDNGAGVDDWWWSTTAYIVKWAIIAAIFVAFLLFFLGGYLHARRRMKRGLAPLSYHRFMVPRRQLAAFYSAHPHLADAQRFQYQQQFSFYRPGYGDSRAREAGAYPMGTYGPPPPAYGHEDYVPAYTPPQGATKMDPDQNYQPPPGPPPQPQQEQQQTGTVALGEASGSSGQQQQHPGGDLGQRGK